MKRMGKDVLPYPVELREARGPNEEVDLSKSNHDLEFLVP